MLLPSNPHKAAIALHGKVLLEPLDVIFQLELLAALAALRRLQRMLKDARAIIFIDNDAARHALVRGDARTPLARWIVQECWLLLAQTSLSRLV